MGLYDDRLADLSESRRPRGARRQVFRPRPTPIVTRPEASRKPMRAQSLLFSRDAGWTPSKAKAWAKAHGYKYGKVDVTDQYVRIRQADPKGSKVKRTVPFGKGIRAVVAKEKRSSMARTRTKVAAKRRRRRSRKSAPAPRRRQASSAQGTRSPVTASSPSGARRGEGSNSS